MKLPMALMSSAASKGIFAIACLCVALGFMGCEQQGPAEEAGEKIDEAAASAGERMDEVQESLREDGESR
jgi:hyperosmotically inducible periplasmic protein